MKNGDNQVRLSPFKIIFYQLSKLVITLPNDKRCESRIKYHTKKCLKPLFTRGLNLRIKIKYHTKTSYHPYGL
jgi:hypothetical protein